jgi:protein ImuA
MEKPPAPLNAVSLSTVEALRQQIAGLEKARHRPGDEVLSSGCLPLDRLLAAGGLRRGTLSEWLCGGAAAGAVSLAMRVAREACRDGGVLIVVDRHRDFYPPAAVRQGIDLQQMIVVHAIGAADNAWALDQSLRCPGVTAVLAWPEKLDGHTFRRLQLAVEEGGGMGMLLRPDTVWHEPSWADVRLLVEPLPTASPQSHRRRLRIHLLRCRGGTDGATIDVELDDETHTVHLAARLADPTAELRAARA